LEGPQRVLPKTRRSSEARAHGLRPSPDRNGRRARVPADQWLWSPNNPRDAAASPSHPRTVKAPETRLDQIVALFFTEHVFGPGRADLLAATDADAAADRDAQAAALKARVRQLETAQNAQILALEQLPADPSDTAATAMRARITTRFAELHADREDTEARLAALAAITPKAVDPALLEELPLAGDIVPGLPPDLRAPAVRRVRPAGLVEQTGPAGHRLRRDHRRHPGRPARHSQSRPGRLR